MLRVASISPLFHQFPVFPQLRHVQGHEVSLQTGLVFRLEAAQLTEERRLLPALVTQVSVQALAPLVCSTALLALEKLGVAGSYGEHRRLHWLAHHQRHRFGCWQKHGINHGEVSAQQANKNCNYFWLKIKLINELIFKFNLGC